MAGPRMAQRHPSSSTKEPTNVLHQRRYRGGPPSPLLIWGQERHCYESQPPPRLPSQCHSHEVACRPDDQPEQYHVPTVVLSSCVDEREGVRGSPGVMSPLMRGPLDLPKPCIASPRVSDASSFSASQSFHAPSPFLAPPHAPSFCLPCAHSSNACDSSLQPSPVLVTLPAIQGAHRRSQAAEAPPYSTQPKPGSSAAYGVNTTESFSPCKATSIQEEEDKTSTVLRLSPELPAPIRRAPTWSSTLPTQHDILLTCPTHGSHPSSFLHEGPPGHPRQCQHPPSMPMDDGCRTRSPSQTPPPPPFEPRSVYPEAPTTCTRPCERSSGGLSHPHEEAHPAPAAWSTSSRSTTPDATSGLGFLGSSPPPGQPNGVNNVIYPVHGSPFNTTLKCAPFPRFPQSDSEESPIWCPERNALPYLQEEQTMGDVPPPPPPPLEGNGRCTFQSCGGTQPSLSLSHTVPSSSSSSDFYSNNSNPNTFARWNEDEYGSTNNANGGAYLEVCKNAFAVTTEAMERLPPTTDAPLFFSRKRCLSGPDGWAERAEASGNQSVPAAYHSRSPSLTNGQEYAFDSMCTTRYDGRDTFSLSPVPSSPTPIPKASCPNRTNDGWWEPSGKDGWDTWNSLRNPAQPSSSSPSYVQSSCSHTRSTTADSSAHFSSVCSPESTTVQTVCVPSTAFSCRGVRDDDNTGNSGAHVDERWTGPVLDANAGSVVVSPSSYSPGMRKLTEMLVDQEARIDLSVLRHQAGDDRHRKQRRFQQTVEAVFDIVQGKLYKARSPSLEHYFREQWRISRAQVYRFLDCATILRVRLDIRTAASAPNVDLGWGYFGVLRCHLAGEVLAQSMRLIMVRFCISLFFRFLTPIVATATVDCLACFFVDVKELSDFQDGPTRERLCRSLKKLAKNRHHRRQLWQAVLDHFGPSERDSVTSTAIQNTWKSLIAQGKVNLHAKMKLEESTFDHNSISCCATQPLRHDVLVGEESKQPQQFSEKNMRWDDEMELLHDGAEGAGASKVVSAPVVVEFSTALSDAPPEYRWCTSSATTLPPAQAAEINYRVPQGPKFNYGCVTVERKRKYFSVAHGHSSSGSNRRRVFQPISDSEAFEVAEEEPAATGDQDGHRLGSTSRSAPRLPLTPPKSCCGMRKVQDGQGTLASDGARFASVGSDDRSLMPVDDTRPLIVDSMEIRAASCASCQETFSGCTAKCERRKNFTAWANVASNVRHTLPGRQKSMPSPVELRPHTAGVQSSRSQYGDSGEGGVGENHPEPLSPLHEAYAALSMEDAAADYGHSEKRDVWNRAPTCPPCPLQPAVLLSMPEPEEQRQQRPTLDGNLPMKRVGLGEPSSRATTPSQWCSRAHQAQLCLASPGLGIVAHESPTNSTAHTRAAIEQPPLRAPRHRVTSKRVRGTSRDTPQEFGNDESGKTGTGAREGQGNNHRPSQCDPAGCDDDALSFMGKPPQTAALIQRGLEAVRQLSSEGYVLQPMIRGQWIIDPVEQWRCVRQSQARQDAPPEDASGEATSFLYSPVPAAIPVTVEGWDLAAIGSLTPPIVCDACCSLHAAESEV